MSQGDVRPRRGTRICGVDDELVAVFLCLEPVDETRGHRRSRTARQLEAVHAREVVGREQAHRTPPRQCVDEPPCEHERRRPLVERQQRDRANAAPDRRDARSPVAQPGRDAARELPGQLRSALGEPVEGRRAHPQQQAVARGADPGGTRASAQQADLADGLPRTDLGHDSRGRGAGLLPIDPDLQTAAHQQVERVRGVSLPEQPLPAAADDGIEFPDDGRGCVGRQCQAALYGEQQRLLRRGHAHASFPSRLVGFFSVRRPDVCEP